jgi:hypothetical protein
MSLLVRALLISAALSLLSTAAAAKEFTALKPLIGSFGKDTEACRSYHRSSNANLTRFSRYEGRYYFRECEGKQCVAEVLSHRTSGTRHVLKVKFTLSNGSLTETIVVKQTGKNTIKISGPDRSQEETFIRCTQKDAVAGIGLPAPDQAIDVDFSAYYAAAALRLCPSLKPGAELASLESLPAYRTREVQEMAAWYAELDKREIANFCNEVLVAFGREGRVAPNLLLPKN